MATRSWTKQYLELRAKAQARRKQDAVALEVKEEADVKIDPALANAPWIAIYEQTKKDITKIREQIRLLKKKHGERLKVNFGDRDDAKHEEEIQQITAQITGLLKRGSNNCGRIAQLGNPKDAPVSVVEKTAILNAIRHLSQELGTLNKDFAKSQKEYAHRLREQESGAGASLLPEDFNSKSTWDDALDGSKPLTDDQQEQLRQLREQASQRDAEIIKIVQAVNELAMMFKQLNTLIHDQGTVLARIDYNIEQAKVQVSKGRVELEKANDISKKSRTMKVIGALALIVIILLIVWIYRISN